MRIVTGTLRGRHIASGQLGSLRLTSSRLKESIFSMLGPDLQGTHFLDLCAGSGQMGLEALSRGAHVVFNEPDRRHLHKSFRPVAKPGSTPAIALARPPST